MELKYVKKYITTGREVFYDIVKKYITNESTILDIGCGDGNFAKYINRPDIYMIDGNIESIKEIEKFYKNATCIKLPYLPYENCFFDLIHSSHVIEHLEVQDLYDLLKEMDRCLKPGGYIVISAPLLWSKFYNDMSHLKPYYPDIFYRYLCSGNQSCCTRPLISNKYGCVEEVYRYNYLPFEDLEIFVGHKYLNWFLSRINKFKYNIGIRKLEKTGFTIVLKKEGN